LLTITINNTQEQEVRINCEDAQIDTGVTPPTPHKCLHTSVKPRVVEPITTRQGLHTTVDIVLEPNPLPNLPELNNILALIDHETGGVYLLLFHIFTNLDQPIGDFSPDDYISWASINKLLAQFDTGGAPLVARGIRMSYDFFKCPMRGLNKITI
jgi:hypothetical protein